MSLATLSSKILRSSRTYVRSEAMRPMTVLSKQSAEEYKKQNYTSRQKALGRPVSPHVTIYAFPVGALSSITNRVTGCILSFGAVGMAAADIIGGGGASMHIMQVIGSQGAIVASTAKFTVAFPIVYHYLGAVRHLAWDYRPEYLETADVEKASKLLFGGSLAISAAFMLF